MTELIVSLSFNQDVWWLSFMSPNAGDLSLPCHARRGMAWVRHGAASCCLESLCACDSSALCGGLNGTQSMSVFMSAKIALGNGLRRSPGIPAANV
ncbi:hypothetical protein E9229_003526 [Paeniglutamicibacter cryotolerans]|uniref:Uncharacterized protein n=1 Tax=Paeniglutamicibacter cryotolerans TaxID=670079 RepID=A0A839QM17_9MICC|nr:hypothetical protein [Paeniglutamicibacter cryotolerans]